MECCYVLTKGKRKGLRCGKKTKKVHCSSHKDKKCMNCCTSTNNNITYGHFLFN